MFYHEHDAYLRASLKETPLLISGLENHHTPTAFDKWVLVKFQRSKKYNTTDDVPPHVS